MRTLGLFLLALFTTITLLAAIDPRASSQLPDGPAARDRAPAGIDG